MGEHLVIKDYNIKILDITKCQLYPFDHLKRLAMDLFINHSTTQPYIHPNVSKLWQN
jgi:hypothetical protein